MIDELQQLGVSRAASEVFSCLLDEAPCFVAPLVRKTKKHRQIIYNALEELQKKGLVVVSKRNGKNWYDVDNSGRLVSSVEHSLILAKQLESEIDKKVQNDLEQVQVFSGSTSYEHGLADFRKRAEESGEYVVIGGENEEWYEKTKHFFASHVADLMRMKRKGVDITILFFANEQKSAEKYIKPFLHDPYRCRISPNKNGLPHTAWLTRQYVYLLTPTTEPLVVRIQSHSLAKKYHAYYQHEWALAKSL